MGRKNFLRGHDSMLYWPRMQETQPEIEMPPAEAREIITSGYSSVVREILLAQPLNPLQKLDFSPLSSGN